MKRKNLVAASQISPAYLAAIENGDRTPSYTILNRLAAAMGMSVSGIIARALEIADDPRNGLIPDGAPWPPTTENTRSDLRKQVRKQPLGW